MNTKYKDQEVRLTVAQLRERLNEFPDEATVCAYEGEKIGIGITSAEGRQIGLIETDFC
jgi:hypothetical protein